MLCYDETELSTLRNPLFTILYKETELFVDGNLLVNMLYEETEHLVVDRVSQVLLVPFPYKIFML